MIGPLEEIAASSLDELLTSFNLNSNGQKPVFLLQQGRPAPGFQMFSG